MTINYGELKRGTSIELEGEPYSVVEYEHSKMQGRAPVMKIRFRSLRTGKILDKTFQGPFGLENELFKNIDESKVYDAGIGGMPVLGGTTTVLYNHKKQKVLTHRFHLSFIPFFSQSPATLTEGLRGRSRHFTCTTKIIITFDSE